MQNKDFAHLHVHNEFSLLDGLGKAKDLVSKAKEMGFKYLALTNHGNIDGLIKFQEECDKQGIFPILGCEAYIVPDMNIKQKGERRGHIGILVKNSQGWHTLCRLLSKANIRGFYHRPRIDYASIMNEDCSGLIFMSACAGSFLRGPHKVDHEGQIDSPPLFDEFLDFIINATEFYLEIMPHNIKAQKEINDIVWAIHKQFGIPLVATNDNHYIEEEDWEAQEVLLAIQRNKKWTDEDRFKFGFKGLYMRSAREMISAFEKQGFFPEEAYLQAMKKTLTIARKCSRFRIPKQDINLPFPSCYLEKGESPSPDLAQDIIEAQCWEALDDLVNEGARDEYRERLERELSIIEEKEFAVYFLIVQELLDWCKDQGIMVGPGRGSVGGSLVAYLMEITQVDPIEYGLLFERFIDIERNDYPDIDIDIEDHRREEVLEHLRFEYGKNSTAAISTFASMKARGVIRDVGRVFSVPYKAVDEFAKSIWPDAQADKRGHRLEGMDSKEAKYFKRKYKKTFQIACRLEGNIRNAGQHAAALIISNEDLTKTDKGVICIRKGHEVCNWDMEDAEYSGLMKLDILGLNTLSVLNEAKRLIYQNYGPEFFYHPESSCYFVDDPSNIPLEGLDQLEHIGPFNFLDVPLDDPEVYDLLSEGKTSGVFQFSGYSTTEIITQIRPSCFLDLAAIVALSRPGPTESGMTEEYIQRKEDLTRDKTWKRKHKIYEDITKDTFGILVYQEQIMRVVSEIAGLPFSTADKIRKIIGKKRDPREFKKYWEVFLDGCLEKETMSHKEAKKFWEGLKEWAGYGFNKAHSIEYALIGYWTAWMKVHYPAEFMCAYLTYGSEGRSKSKQDLLAEARRMGLQMVLPKVGISDPFKWVAKDKRLYVPFIEVKGIGDKTAIQITSSVQKKGQEGFFTDEETRPQKIKPGSALDKLLIQINAYSPDDLSIPREAKSLFDFPIHSNPSLMYPNLSVKTLGFSIRKGAFPAYSSLDFDEMPIKISRPVINRGRFLNKKVLGCDRCELRQEAKAPVLPSMGMYNIAIIGEAPGPQEDKYKRAFYEKAPAGKLLWETLDEFFFQRKNFHVTNICKCYPGRRIKTPEKKHIEACLPWLKEELRELGCRLALVFGNTGVKAFTEDKSGITTRNGTTEWIEDFGLWVCWCVHPAYVVRNPSDENKALFFEGIENFVDKIDGLRKQCKL